MSDLMFADVQFEKLALILAANEKDRRRKEIEELMKQGGRTAQQLAGKFGLSTATIRARLAGYKV